MAQHLLAPHGTARTPPTVRVASVPSGHVYVRHLSPPSDAVDGVVRLRDPRPPAGAEQSPWWPPTMLDPRWVRAHHESFDVFHVHFGFDARTTDQLRELVHALSDHDKPLVMTVHDLRNPHHVDRDMHDAQLDVLVPAAAAVVTLTPGAAAEIWRRWQRRAVVVPHPHVIELDEMDRLQATHRTARSGTFRVGLHVKSLRAGMDPHTVLPALVRAVGDLDDAVLQVNGHPDVLTASGARYDRDLADLLRGAGDGVDVRVHDFFDDQQLWHYLASLDVSVLPYRFGTHSGWLEACRDIGTTVVAPSCGFYAEQGPVESFELGEDRFDAHSLIDAVRRARENPAAAATVADREHQRRSVAGAHRSLYAAVLGEPRGGVTPRRA